MKLSNYISFTVLLLVTTTCAHAQIPCDTITGKICRSIVTDTAFNPYVTGVLGNWRGNRSYTWYSTRKETEPSGETDTRRFGSFADFASFWQFQDNKLLSQPDTNRWVWNSEITKINRKGFEVENKDPLGRYNAGLYGYNLTLPTAVVQNSRYRESAFEGFEDYGFITQICDTGCTAQRHIDYSPYRSKIDATQKHSGTSSLKLLPHETVGLSFGLTTAADDTITSRLQFNTQSDPCVDGGMALGSIKVNNKILLPAFSPTKGAQMVLSAWVKENNGCNCTVYRANKIIVAFSGGSASSDTLFPAGNIIEGWQRYEGFFTIPPGNTVMTVSLAADTATVYFDDLRIHPFNANMKSFVYHPVNLRLMAELDENNYATFYEYDDDGTLIRLKKETQRGIKTIKETRSALLKE